MDDETKLLLAVALGCGECDACLRNYETFLTRERDEIAEHIREAAGLMMNLDLAIRAVRERKSALMDEEIGDLLGGQGG